MIQKEDSKQTKIGTAHRVKQIFERRHDRLARSVVHDKRHRAQRHQLIKQVHRHKISREIQSDQHAVDQQEESEKPPLLALVLHIHKGIKADRYPDDRDKGHKQPADRIDPKIDRNPFHQVKQPHLMLTAPGRKKCKHRCEHQNRSDKAMQLFPLLLIQIVPYVFSAAAQMAFEGTAQQADSGERRQKHRQQNPTIHFFFLLCKHRKSAL